MPKSLGSICRSTLIFKRNKANYRNKCYFCRLKNEATMKYPIGIQSFEKIRTEGFVYIDKTTQIYNLATYGTHYFLSRPRRFGKSLLLSTMKAYFQGKKELFDGLAIAELEKEWKSYPVLHIDLNAEKYNTPEALDSTLNRLLLEWEKMYGTGAGEDTLSNRFHGVIARAAMQSENKKVVILVDEYDKPLLEAIGKPELQEDYRQTLKAFYSNIKSCDEYIRFAFLTGVTKFSHLSVFSGLNNLIDITMLPQYAEICGISEAELHRDFDESVNDLATANSMTKEQCYARLKKEYDGYHFYPNSEGMYNPFSLLNTLAFGVFKHYWFATGTPSFLVEVLQRADYPLDRLTSEDVDAQTLDSVDMLFRDPIPLFFQSGYLTIKDYSPEFRSYRLGFPNEEVEEGFAQFMTAYYYNGYMGSNFSVRNFVQEVERGEVESFLNRLQAFYADGDYQLTGKLEVYFQNSLLMLFKLMGFYVQVERHTSRGRMDVTIQTRDYIYILELKVDKTADEALQQIEDKQYAAPFAADPRTLYKIGVCFSSTDRGIAEWKIGPN